MGVSVGKGVDVESSWVETGEALGEAVPSAGEEEHSNSAAVILAVISGLLVS